MKESNDFNLTQLYQLYSQKENGENIQYEAPELLADAQTGLNIGLTLIVMLVIFCLYFAYTIIKRRLEIQKEKHHNELIMMHHQQRMIRRHKKKSMRKERKESNTLEKTIESMKNTHYHYKKRRKWKATPIARTLSADVIHAPLSNSPSFTSYQLDGNVEKSNEKTEMLKKEPKFRPTNKNRNFRRKSEGLRRRLTHKFVSDRTRSNSMITTREQQNPSQHATIYSLMKSNQMNITNLFIDVNRPSHPIDFLSYGKFRKMRKNSKDFRQIQKRNSMLTIN
ncbi:hypothetical protein SNEBB_011003 [Seison nebaliae]|nr:hypothetical protein SNEBB_011003 [Seison nebaliae]